MTNSTWAAACLRTSLLSSRGTAASLPATAYVEYRRALLDGVEKRHVLGGFMAVQIDAQVKDTGAPAPLGPHPWRPPE